MIYRDSMERCPRCGTDLEDAGAARGCRSCNGLWLSFANMQEMAAQMQTPPRHVALLAAPVKREPLACPTCTEPMQTLELFSIAIDACEKKHGVWFDANELGQMLFASAQLA